MTKNHHNIVVGMGEALWDILPEGKKIGGAPANFAYHASQFGLDSRVVSAIGDDPLGQELTEQFNSKKLKQEIAVVPYQTGTVRIALDPQGVPHYEIKENVAWDNIPFTDRLHELALHTRAVCFGSLAQRHIVSRNTINSFLDTMPDRKDNYKIFDINLRQNFYTREIIHDSMRRCNILKINDEELLILNSIFDYPLTGTQDLCRFLLSRYDLRMLILTCGANGSYVFSPDNISFIETPQVEVSDTVGAGDSFTASFISSLIQGHSIPEAHEIAVKVSAYVCTQNGAMPELPHYLKGNTNIREYPQQAGI